MDAQGRIIIKAKDESELLTKVGLWFKENRPDDRERYELEPVWTGPPGRREVYVVLPKGVTP